LTRVFKKAVDALQEDSEAFFDFFDRWGTHFVTKVDLSARYGKVSYLSEHSVKDIEQQGVSVEVAAAYAGTLSLNGSVGTASKAQDSFLHAQKYVREISVGAAPPTGADGTARDAWVSKTRKQPMPIGYSLEPVCELFQDGSVRKAACLAATPKYCPARLDRWRARSAHARCDVLSTTTTTTTTVNTSCKGCPPRCCSGGCAGEAWTLVRDNWVAFRGLRGFGDITVEWSMDTCSVSPGEPFGQSDFSPSSGPAVETRDNRILVRAGRSRDKANAHTFHSGLEASNLLGISERSVMKPDRLNFAITGTLTLSFGGQSLTFPDFRLGQGNKGSGDNAWWMGSAACNNKGFKRLVCKSQEGDYLQFRGNWHSWIFEVGHA